MAISDLQEEGCTHGQEGVIGPRSYTDDLYDQDDGFRSVLVWTA
jgi:hypothetical protein